jgi:hypothetical protein
MNPFNRWTTFLAFGLALLLPAIAWSATVETIATGLDNPRGIDFGPNGKLYVAEAGRGGDSDKCIPAAEGDALKCLGMTGALTRIDPDGIRPPKRIIEGLPSLAVEGGVPAEGGPVDISWGRDGDGYLVLGFGGDPEARQDLGPDGRLLGTVLRVDKHGKYRKVGDVLRHERLRNPDGGEQDTNPYSVLALHGRQIVADAGGNSLVRVQHGHTQTLATFPGTRLAPLPFPPFDLVPFQSVPTTVVKGPDGALYIGELTGFPFPVGAANVYRLVPGCSELEVYLTGFTNIVDIAFGPQGELYVLEIAASSLIVGPPGELLRVDPDGTRTVVAGGLVFPAGVTVGRDGTLYVTNFGIFPGAGQVLRITQD